MIITKTISSLVLVLLVVNSTYAINAYIYIDSIDIPNSYASVCANPVTRLEVKYSTDSKNDIRNASIVCYLTGASKVIIIGDYQPAANISEMECTNNLVIDMTLHIGGAVYALPFEKSVSNAFGDQRRSDKLTLATSSSTTLSSITPSPSTVSTASTSSTSAKSSSSTTTTTSSTSRTLSTTIPSAPSVILHWGLLIDGTCTTQATQSDTCLSEYIIIGVESLAIAIILFIGVYFQVKSRGGCSCPSVSFTRRQRVVAPTPVIRQDNMWENENGYGTNGVSGGDVSMISYPQSPSQRDTSPGRSNPPLPLKPQATNGQQRNNGLKDRFKRDKTVPLPLPKDFQSTDDYDEINDGAASVPRPGRQPPHRQVVSIPLPPRQHPHHQIVPADDWNEDDYDDVGDGRQEQQDEISYYDDVDDANRHRRHN